MKKILQSCTVVKTPVAHQSFLWQCLTSILPTSLRMQCANAARSLNAENSSYKQLGPGMRDCRSLSLCCLPCRVSETSSFSRVAPCVSEHTSAKVPPPLSVLPCSVGTSHYKNLSYPFRVFPKSIEALHVSPFPCTPVSTDINPLETRSYQG